MTPSFFLENGDGTVPISELYTHIANQIESIPEVQQHIQQQSTMDWTPLHTLANWAAWVGLALFVISLIILFAKMSNPRNASSGVVNEEISTGLKALVVGAFLITSVGTIGSMVL